VNEFLLIPHCTGFKRSVEQLSLLTELHLNGREMQKNLYPHSKPWLCADGSKIAVRKTQNQLAKHETYQIKK
jgi:hypothetical protein